MSFDADLAELERAIRALSHEYDAFLFGAKGKLPAESRKKLEGMIRRIANAELETPAERFRLNTLLGQYNSRCELWERQLREKEEGVPQRIHRAAGSISLNEPAPASVKKPREAPSADRIVYDRYVAARQAQGEDLAGLDFERFQKTLAREREKLEEKTGRRSWEFDVSVEDGKVKLKAKPGKGGDRT